jgi:hypothetical protein
VLVAEAGPRAIGLEVAGPGGARRLLPWVTPTRREDGLSIPSALARLVAAADGPVEPVSTRPLAGTGER